MIFAYVGNFHARYSTENDVARALRNNGHQVVQINEKNLHWPDVPRLVDGADVFLWTRTAGFDPPNIADQADALEQLDVPKVGYHLDRWWGLDREPAIHESPWFTLDLLCTADGSDRWDEAGINHRWFPPAISAKWLTPGHYRRHLQSDVAFVGNLLGYGHQEWAPYRQAIHDRFPNLRLFPQPGQKAIRGEPLADVYASGRVFIGDSCLVGDPPRYWSDRIPETLGRGGFLIHPEVVGLRLHHPDLVTYTLGDLDELAELVDYYLAHDDLRKGVAEENRRHVSAHHTYEHRMERLVDVLQGEGLI